MKLNLVDDNAGDRRHPLPSTHDEITAPASADRASDLPVEVTAAALSELASKSAGSGRR